MAAMQTYQGGITTMPCVACQRMIFVIPNAPEFLCPCGAKNTAPSAAAAGGGGNGPAGSDYSTLGPGGNGVGGAWEDSELDCLNDVPICT